MENEEKYLKNTPNEKIAHLYYLSEVGFICSMIYSPDGEFLIVGHSTGLIQVIFISNVEIGSNVIARESTQFLVFREYEQSMPKDAKLRRKKCCS